MNITFNDVAQCFPQYPNLQVNDVVQVQHWKGMSRLVNSSQDFKEVLLHFAKLGYLEPEKDSTTMFHLTQKGLNALH